MAKIEDILKRAVETEDWLLACNLYTQITGKVLSPPSLSKPPPQCAARREIQKYVSR